jgi:formate dehydrogenase subunit delta
MNKPDKLAAMANQIAGFFKTQPGDPAANIADHLKTFWTVSMCAALVAHVEAGGAIDPAAREAVEKLKVTTV